MNARLGHQSRGAAAECSPGRQPGVLGGGSMSTGDATDYVASFAPPGLWPQNDTSPRADGRVV